MDFRNVNLLNNRMNMLSGILLPMASDCSRFSMAWRIYRVVILSIEVVQIAALIAGLILAPREKALKDGPVAVAITVEVIVMTARLYTHKKLLKQIIQKLNDILRDSDEIMEGIVKSILKSAARPLMLYGTSGMISVIVWTAQPIILAFDRNIFYYEDYNLPTAFTNEPFSTYVMIPSTVVMTIGNMFRFLKKLSLDTYMIHLVLLLTAQYRYAAMKLTILFRDLQDNNKENGKGPYPPEANQAVERELRMLCRHHNTIMRISFMLKKLLSLNFSLIYLSSIFRFCFTGIMITTVPSLTFSEGISVTLFACSALFHFYLFCSAVQMLLEASTKVTDKAFNEGWYQLRPSKQRAFLFLIMANNLECKISTTEKFNLSLPSFITIMNQSYSIALLLLRFK